MNRETGPKELRKAKYRTVMVRVTSGAVPRLHLVSVRSNRGRRIRACVAFFLSFLLVAYGFYGTNSLAQSGEPWDGNPANGDVQVSRDKVNISSSLSLTLKAGESVTYWLRLSRQPLTNGWFVRIFVNGQHRPANGYYPPEATRDTADYTWIPDGGWDVDIDNTDPEEPTRWRGVTFTAKKDITTPIKIMHEVWATGGECPIHERGKITISGSITNPDTTTTTDTTTTDTTTTDTTTTDTDTDNNNPYNNNPGTNNEGNGGGGGSGGGGVVPRNPAQQNPPTPVSAKVDGNKLVLTFNELLDRGSVPAPGDFTVSAHDVESLSLSGSRVTMILETPALPGEEVTLSYTPGKNPIKSITGLVAPSFTNLPVENIGKAPVLVDASVRGNQITLTYDEPLDETSVPTTGSYTVMVAGANRPISKVRVKGKKVFLTLESAVEPGEEVTLNYTPGSPRIVDLTAIPAGPINNLQINNSAEAPEVSLEGTNDWLTRFGRTVASQAVEMIENRLKAPSKRQESSVTLAGQDVDFFGDNSPLPLSQDDPEFASASRLASRTLGFGGLSGNDPAAEHREISMSDLLLASSFHLTSAQNTETGGGTLWTTWGRGSRTSFFGDEDSSTFNGDVTTGTIGADFEWGRTMVGVALSHTLGEGYFSIDGRRNDVEARLTGVYPYMRYTVSEHLTVWGMFGFGNGEYAQTEQGVGEEIETDISMRMGAFGFRSFLFPPAHPRGYDLALKGDVMVVKMEADEVRDKLLPVDTNTNRFRLLLEGSREYKLGRGASLTPSLEMGVRYDKGDAEEGGGIEVGGGFRYFDPSLDMVIDVNARGLLAHEESRFSEKGVSGSLQLTWGTKKKGLSVRVGSSWGDAASGAERLWSQASTASLSSSAHGEGARMEAEVGYGLDAPGGGTFKPYAGLALAARGSESYRLGGRLQIDDRVSLRLEGDRRERAGGKSSHGLALLGSIRW